MFLELFFTICFSVFVVQVVVMRLVVEFWGNNLLKCIFL